MTTLDRQGRPRVADRAWARLLLAIALSSAASTALAQPAPRPTTYPGAFRHDGFLLEFAMTGELQGLRDRTRFVTLGRVDGADGADGADRTSEAGRVTALGQTGGLSIALGGAVSERVTLAGRLEFSQGATARVSLGGRRVALGDAPALTAMGIDSLVRIQLPQQLAVTAGLGFGVVVLSTDDLRPDSDRTADEPQVPGVGPLRLQLSLLRQFWVSNNWSTGVRSRVLLTGPVGTDAGGFSLAVGLAWLWVYQ